MADGVLENDPDWRIADADALVARHYDTLKRLARAKRRRAGPQQTMLTTDVLHESWMRIRDQGGWANEAHFMRTAALAMRHVLIDHARARLSLKRGGGARPDPIEDIESLLPEFAETPEEIVAIGDLMAQLGRINPRWLDVVDLRYFGGFTEAETAQALDVTERTVRRDWTAARAWLAAEIRTPGEAGA